VNVVFHDELAGTSSCDAAELLMAVLRERRERLQKMIRMVKEQAGRNPRAMDAGALEQPPTRYQCRRTSTLTTIRARRVFRG
jgi:hypothetical protein